MNVVDIINKAISERRTRFAFELLPPLKGDGCCGVFGSIDRLIGFDPAYINVTFHREGIKQAVRPDGSVEWHVVRRRPGTVGISAAIQKKYDVEVVPHLICGGQSKYDIEDALIDLDFLGLHNVLALRGDKSQNEKFFMPHPQGHTHAVDLVRQIAAMNRGQFVDGEVEECHHSKFSIGVAGYPEMHEEAASPEADIACLKAKVDAGAEYVVTQLFYDNARFFDYVRRCREAISPRNSGARCCATRTTRRPSAKSEPSGPSPRAGSWSKRASPSCTTTRWARPTTSSRLQKRYFKRHE